MKEMLRYAWLVGLTALLICGAVLLLCGWLSPFFDSIVTDSGASVKEQGAVWTENQPDGRIIILDPGHGGEDPGAIGVDGVLEKDLNLAAALRLRDLLIFNGWKVIMTRSDDRLLYDPELTASHKVQDLKNRLDYGKLYPNAIFVSIHMNKFPDSDCAGLQVYYSGNHESSATLAESIRESYAQSIADGKSRVCKEATSAIYILHRIEIPAVLVECGFLSNPHENELLQDADYQKKLAAVMALAITEYFADQTQIPQS